MGAYGKGSGGSGGGGKQGLLRVERRVNDDWNAACNQDEENWQP